MPGDEINNPVHYSTSWLAVGLLGILLAIAVIVITVIATKPRRPKPPAPVPLPAPGTDPWAQLRSQVLDTIEQIAETHAQGHIDDRALHLELSAAVRTFAGGRLGIDASTKTLLEIARRQEGTPLVELVAYYYRPTFADDDELRIRPGADPYQSIQLARRVVSFW